MSILGSIRIDHTIIRELLEELVALDPADDYRFVLLEQLEHLILPHSRSEEVILYNSIRALKSDTSEVIESYHEHAEIDAYLRALQVKEDTDLEWKETAELLQSKIVGHIDNEEDVIFKDAHLLFNSDELDAMGMAFEELKNKYETDGVVRTSADLIVNLLPPHLFERIRDLKSP
ncbi:hemerythrin domain-containing protein [Peredibacter starrii]|uniref:Hemerythrin domain-containing protein n=1 Tax=Peredibacter starrii TaxID=28202 RepID=A0AAX4HNT1_9BACT|nr:hemerythrin domain-containing protein [Peredibacter starrii]WPU64830.1 hemerythrin domain-containing protein [Peredibacter starrii]